MSVWLVVIQGIYEKLEIRYPSYKEALAGKKRAENKIAFAKDKIYLVRGSTK